VECTTGTTNRFRPSIFFFETLSDDDPPSKTHTFCGVKDGTGLCAYGLLGIVRRCLNSDPGVGVSIFQFELTFEAWFENDKV
jgi:hypothetical protein